MTNSTDSSGLSPKRGSTGKLAPLYSQSFDPVEPIEEADNPLMTRFDGKLNDQHVYKPGGHVYWTCML